MRRKSFSISRRLYRTWSRCAMASIRRLWNRLVNSDCNSIHGSPYRINVCFLLLFFIYLERSRCAGDKRLIWWGPCTRVDYIASWDSCNDDRRSFGLFTVGRTHRYGKFTQRNENEILGYEIAHLFSEMPFTICVYILEKSLTRHLFIFTSVALRFDEQTLSTSYLCLRSVDEECRW